MKTNLRSRKAQLRALKMINGGKAWTSTPYHMDRAKLTTITVYELTTITVYVRLTDAENKSVEDIAEFVFDLRRALTPAKKKRKAK